MRLLIFTFSLLCFSSFLSAQDAASSARGDQEIRYISDDLFIFLHAGPARKFRIVGSINAGSTVSLLEVNNTAGFTKVVDERERTGWVESKYLSDNPSIRVSLQNAESELNALQQEASQMRKNMNAALSNFEEADNQKESLNSRLTKSLEKNIQLESYIEKQARSDKMQWFTRGAILALISLFIGYLMGLFTRKKGRSNRIM
jgi:SH3 domain protein